MGVWGMEYGVWGVGYYQLFRVSTGNKCSGLNGGCAHENDRVLLTGHLIIM